MKPRFNITVTIPTNYNKYKILERVYAELLESGVDKKEIDEFLNCSMHRSRQHFLKLAQRWVNIKFLERNEDV